MKIYFYKILFLFHFIKSVTSVNCFKSVDGVNKESYEIKFDQIGTPNNELVKDLQEILLEIDSKLEENPLEITPSFDANDLLISLYNCFEQLIGQKFPQNWKYFAQSCVRNRNVKQHEKLLCLYGKIIAFIQMLYKFLLENQMITASKTVQERIDEHFAKMNAIFKIVAATNDSNYMRYNFESDDVQKMVNKMTQHKSFKKLL